MTNRIIAWLTGLLTLALAVFAFVLSFNALTELAAQHGITIPILFPLIVEFAVVIFSFNALYRSLNGEGIRVQWVLIIGSSLIAGTFNVIHAKPDFVSQTMAAMPSLFLLLSFETFLSQIKHAVERSTVVQSLTALNSELSVKQIELDTLLSTKEVELNTLLTEKQNEIERLNMIAKRAEEKVEHLKGQVKSLKTVQSSSIEQARRQKSEQDADTLEQRHDQILSILKTEGDIGPSAFVKRLKVSRTTVYNDFKNLSEAGVILKEGDTWVISKKSNLTQPGEQPIQKASDKDALKRSVEYFTNGVAAGV